MGRSCVVPGCKSNYKNVKNNSIFKVPDEAGMLKRWEAAIPGELKLKSSHFICKKHFEDKYVIKKYVKYDANGKVIAEVPFKHPRLDNCAIPTIFGDYEIQQSLAVASLENPIECNDSSLISDELSLPPASINEMSDRYSATDTLNEVLVKRRYLVQHKENPIECKDSSLISDELSLPPASINKMSDYYSVTNTLNEVLVKRRRLVQHEATVPDSDNDRNFDFPTISVIINECKLSNVNYQKTFSITIPKSWSVSQVSKVSGQRLLFSYARMITKNGLDIPIIQKCVTLYPDKTLRYHIYGHVVNSKKAMFVEVLDKTEALSNILDKFERMNVCSGIGAVNVYHLQIEKFFQNYLQKWHHNDCSLISENNRCDNCLKQRKIQLQKEARFKKCKTCCNLSRSRNQLTR